MSTESAISLDSFETVVIGTAFWFSTAMRQRGERLIKAGKRRGWVFFLSEKTLITRLQCESGGLRKGGGGGWKQEREELQLIVTCQINREKWMKMREARP